ncbi:MarR family transcriptional regulator [Micromonospora sp. NPDC094482]|uniref:MarR family winged helix-turn-helix transcriptional regulator n=1 Tax=unclassified Micromonospora TaxID=2617518 RepID=UPI0033188F79
MKRSVRKRQDPDLGVLAARLFFGLQEELFRRSAEEGFDDITPRHGAVLAYLDEDGIRPSELAHLSGRHKQTIGTIVDELEKLGYLRREADPADRRAKLIMPTERGRRLMRYSDLVVAEIEARHAALLGTERYGQFKSTLRVIATAPPAPPAPPSTTSSVR